MNDHPPQGRLRVVILVAIFSAVLGWELAETAIQRSDSNSGYVAGRITSERPVADAPISPSLFGPALPSGGFEPGLPSTRRVRSVPPKRVLVALGPPISLGLARAPPP